jgi:hypothetical protein
MQVGNCRKPYRARAGFGTHGRRSVALRKEQPPKNNRKRSGDAPYRRHTLLYQRPAPAYYSEDNIEIYHVGISWLEGD